MSVARLTDLTKRIDAYRLIEESCAETGLSDFGNPDLDPAYFAMVDAINESAALTPHGAEGRRHHIKHLLTNRLKLTEYMRRNESVAEADISTPIFIIGLPRSGTTKLHRLMARDSQFNTTRCGSAFLLSLHLMAATIAGSASGTLTVSVELWLRNVPSSSQHIQSSRPSLRNVMR